MEKQLYTRIQHKRDTHGKWSTKNPILKNGEIVFIDVETGEFRMKVGDGTTPYTLLPYADTDVRDLIGNCISAEKIVNSVSSTDTKAPLSANMGRYLYHVLIPSEYVSAVTAQSFTTNEKKIARENIGALENVTEWWSFELEDGTVVNKEVGAISLKKFTIDGAAYYCAPETTWREWVDSAYNTGGFTYSTEFRTVSRGGYTVMLNYLNVAITDYIGSYDYLINYSEGAEPS